LASELTKPGSTNPTEFRGYEISGAQAIKENFELLRKHGTEVDDESGQAFLEGLRSGFETISASWSSGALEKSVSAAETEALGCIIQEASAAQAGDCAKLVNAAAAAIASVVKTDGSKKNRCCNCFRRHKDTE